MNSCLKGWFLNYLHNAKLLVGGLKGALLYHSLMA